MPDDRSGSPFLLYDSLLLCGPTAVGKSAVALRLAERLGGEIISVDSMQVYGGLDLGTAKPSAADRARVLHHLIDVVGISDAFDAAQFVQLARQAVRDIRGRGKLPILCGGTGLYFKAFLQGLGETPPAEPKLRAELERTPLNELLKELSERDPRTWERIDRQNPRRVIRAVEVIRLTGKPYSSQRAAWGGDPGCSPAVPGVFGLERSSADLRCRIDLRVDEMFRSGLVAETKRLLGYGLAGNRTAMQALGYRQVVEYLDGARSLADTVELVKVRTRQFAKRQMTWFRRQLKVEWFSVAPDERVDDVADRVVAEFVRKGSVPRGLG
jgi:tRNA dimethylallyltransferase